MLQSFRGREIIFRDRFQQLRLGARQSVAWKQSAKDVPNLGRDVRHQGYVLWRGGAGGTVPPAQERVRKPASLLPPSVEANAGSYAISSLNFRWKEALKHG